MTKHLTADISATVRDKKKVTVKKGSEVTIISMSDYNEIAIVEHNGVRFPINKMYLK